MVNSVLLSLAWPNSVIDEQNLLPSLSAVRGKTTVLGPPPIRNANDELRIGGSIVYQDSPLVQAAQYGRVLLIDEADKAPLEVCMYVRHIQVHACRM